MSLYAAQNRSDPDTQKVTEAVTAVPARARSSQSPPNSEDLHRALAIRGQQLQAARRRIDELQVGNSLLRQEVARLEHEVTTAHSFSYHDELTGLPNRRLLLDRFHQVVARGIRQQQLIVLLFIDIDGFKRINDAFGHAAGDRVLEQVGSRLTGCIRASDTACRFGGDEFVVLLPEIQNREHAVFVKAKMRAQLEVPYSIGQLKITCSASIGMAVCPSDGCELDDLIKASDCDMYCKKKARGNRRSDLLILRSDEVLADVR